MFNLVTLLEKKGEESIDGEGAGFLNSQVVHSDHSVDRDVHQWHLQCEVVQVKLANLNGQQAILYFLNLPHKEELVDQFAFLPVQLLLLSQSLDCKLLKAVLGEDDL